jgi:hypothetical protein
VEKFQRVEDNFAALQAALREIQADNSDKVNSFGQVLLGATDINALDFFVYFFGGLECVGHSFAYVAHL